MRSPSTLAALALALCVCLAVTHAHSSDEATAQTQTEQLLRGAAVPRGRARALNSCTSCAPVLDVQLGDDFSCALLQSVVDVVRCWGAGLEGRLGTGSTANVGDGPGEMGEDLTDVDFGTGRWAVSISAGVVSDHACAVLNGLVDLKCWGDNSNGQLGQGDTTDRGDDPGEMGDALPVIALGAVGTIKDVQLMIASTCVLFDAGSIKCFGSNGNGQLGYGDTDNRGDGAGEMGASLPFVDLGTGRTAKQLSCGGHHCCAVLDNDGTKCWGNGFDGQLGSASSASIGDAPGEMGDSLAEVDLGPNVHATQVSCGGRHTCVLLDDFSTKCFGYNLYGQLGYGDKTDRGDGSGEMGSALPAVSILSGAEEAAYGHVSDLSSGDRYTCAKTQLGGKLKCWGYGHWGQLGYEDGSRRGNDEGEMGGALPFVSLGTAQVVTARTGHTHTCVLLDDSAIKCFGRNVDGQLGYGDQQSRGDEPGEMGAALQRVHVGPGTVVTAAPSMAPSSMPTAAPASMPTAAPTTMPSTAPNTAPTTMPSSVPSAAPTQNPSSAPMRSPTAAATRTPSVSPAPSSTPPIAPSTSPTDRGLPADDDGAADDDDGDSGGILGLSDRQVVGVAVVGGVGLVLIIGIASFFKQRAGRGGRSGGGGGGGGGKNAAATNHVAKANHVVMTNHAAAPTDYV